MLTEKCRYMSVLHGLVQLIHVHQLKRSCGEVCLPSVTMATTLTHQSMTINSTTTHTHHNNTPSTAWSRDYPYPPPHSISSWKRGRRRIFRSEVVLAWDHHLEIHVRVHCHTWHMRLWMLRDASFLLESTLGATVSVKAGHGDECSYFFVLQLWNTSVPHLSRCTRLFMERERGGDEKEMERKRKEINNQAQIKQLDSCKHTHSVCILCVLY